MANRKVTILMYHYVRTLKNSRYPNIKGLEVHLFNEQISYLIKHYNFISVQQLITAAETGNSLPPKSVLLTFNDCYIDHFNNVFPVLDSKEIKGCFFPEVGAVLEDKVLPNHKIHFILAKAEDTKAVINAIYSLLNERREKFNLCSNKDYYQRLAIASGYDSKDTVFIKRLLQTELEEKVRNIIIDELFNKFVGIDEKVFSRELYLNKEHIECMLQKGMHFGMVGYGHPQYNLLEKERQKTELEQARDFLIGMGIKKSELTASYPWGAYNKDTLDILRQLNCKVAFTTVSGIVDLDKQTTLELPRLDTNEIPSMANAAPNNWFKNA